jgi:predicted DNA-binding protein (UPF0251 family)
LCRVAGEARLALGRDDEAVAWLRRAVEANRMYSMAQFSLAAALAQQGNTEQEAAADRLGLSYGTYRRYLTTALGRLARWLWDQERETRAG